MMTELLHPFAVWWRREALWRRRVIWFPAALIVAFNMAMALNDIFAMARGSDPIDWFMYAEASSRVHEGGLYADSDAGFYHYRYSPVLAYGTAILGFIGIWAWRALHLVAVALLPTWPLRIAVLLSWPFWFDVSAGNVMVFVAIIGFLAIRGSTLASLAFFTLAVLIPRPLMLPLVAWQLWKRPDLRLPFVGIFVLHAAAVGLTGWGDEWLARLVGTGAEEMGSLINYAPSRIIGIWWMVIAAPLSVLAWLRGWIGLSSLLISPYWLPYYGLILVLDADRVGHALSRLQSSDTAQGTRSRRPGLDAHAP